jgi:hypothetical protein
LVFIEVTNNNNNNKERTYSMSETQAPVIKRNGVDFQFTKGTTGKKHSNPGLDFWFPEVTDEQIKDPNVLQWFGDVTANALNKVTRLIFIDMAIEYTVDGVFNVEGWTNAAPDFTAGRAKIADLEEELTSLTDINLALTEKIIALVDSEGADLTDPRVMALHKQVQDNHINRIRPLRTKIVEIKAKYAKIVAARAALAA